MAIHEATPSQAMRFAMHGNVHPSLPQTLSLQFPVLSSEAAGQASLGSHGTGLEAQGELNTTFGMDSDPIQIVDRCKGIAESDRSSV